MGLQSGSKWGIQNGSKWVALLLNIYYLFHYLNDNFHYLNDSHLRWQRQ